MNYSEPLVNQIYRFVLSVGFGVIMSVFYEVVSCFFLIISNGKKSVFIRDVLFSVVFTVMSFFFMLVYNEGEIRFNLIFGQLLGLAAFHITFGKTIQLPFLKIAKRNRLKIKFKKYKKNKN